MPPAAFGVGATRCSFVGFPSTGFGVGVGATRSEEFDFELLTVAAPTGLGVGVGVGAAAKAAEASPKANRRAASARNCLFFMARGYALHS
jgi:hypothetical protein